MKFASNLMNWDFILSKNFAFPRFAGLEQTILFNLNESANVLSAKTLKTL